MLTAIINMKKKKTFIYDYMNEDTEIIYISLTKYSIELITIYIQLYFPPLFYALIILLEQDKLIF